MEKQGFVDVSEAVLISDLLYYAWNKLKCLSLEDVVAICDQFYTDDNYVFNEKKKLFDAIGESCSSRKKEDKRARNIEDICLARVCQYATVWTNAS